MSLIHELKREIQEAKKLRRLSWRTKLLMVVIGTPMFFLYLIHGGRVELFWPSVLTVIVLGVVIRFKWKLRKQAWFWATMAVIAVLHVLWVLFVPWTTKWIPVFVYTGLATVDFVLILWILLVIEKFMEGPKTADR
ncbi:MAG TPA: hypothetical protein VJQ50_07510 [Terriglobales bacterium]|nr:hypothetical protein [Terriglobales bacterium]